MRSTGGLCSPPARLDDAPCVDKADQVILDSLAAGNGRSTHEIATAIGLTACATRSRLLKLVGCGLVREIGTSSQDSKRRYFRAG